MIYNNNLRKIQKEEAILRMIAMNILPYNIKDFMEFDTVYVSRDFGILYQLDDEEKAVVKRIEEEYDMLVYHVIDSVCYGDRMLTLFFVSKYTDEWEKDRRQLMQGRQNCYVVNCDYNKFSECGSIGFKAVNGGLVRTW